MAIASLKVEFPMRQAMVDVITEEITEYGNLTSWYDPQKHKWYLEHEGQFTELSPMVRECIWSYEKQIERLSMKVKRLKSINRQLRKALVSKGEVKTG